MQVVTYAAPQPVVFGSLNRGDRVRSKSINSYGPTFGTRSSRKTAKRQTVFMFAGQGSHYFQMGLRLYEQHAVFRDSMHEMDALVRDLSGYSVIEVLYHYGHRKSETFDRILLSHPAIFMVEYATAQVLLEAGVIPDLLLGTSIGSFVCAALSGALSMTDALIALIRQSSIVESCCVPGGMLAVLHDKTILEQPTLWEESEVAAINLPTHFVVSAHADALNRLNDRLIANNIVPQRLPIPFAFNSRWIDNARVPFMRFAQSSEYRTPEIPIVCPVGCEILSQLSPDYLWRAVRRPIRLFDTITQLERRGSYRYIDVGPSATLSAIAQKVLSNNPSSDSVSCSTLSPLGDDFRSVESLLVSE